MKKYDVLLFLKLSSALSKLSSVATKFAFAYAAKRLGLASHESS
jgi:hypothetical protein